jgi:hypothetical protein
MPTKPISLKPVMPLIPEVLLNQDEDKAKFITLEVKTRAGGPIAGNTHKKHVRIFAEGSPQQWVDLMEAVQIIWLQNGTTGATDRASMMRAMLKGEILTAFEAALDDARINPDPLVLDLIPMTGDHVDTALTAVGATIFPHRALELQRLWMSRYMRKPADMPIRKLAMSVTRINNCLPLFPGGTASSKYTEPELIHILEWSLPASWRAKFDLDGYIPTDESKAKLVQEGEAIERNETPRESTYNDNNNKNKNNKKSKFGKPASAQRKSEDAENRFHCEECGYNPSHPTAKCFKIINREKRTAFKPGQSGHNSPKDRPFSKRTFRKEANAIVRKAAKKDSLELLATSLKREQTKVARRSKKAKAKKDQSDSGSDSDESVNVIEHVFDRPIPRKTNTRELIVNKDDPMEITESEIKDLRTKLESLKVQLKQAKQDADNRASDEEKTFLEKISQMELAERASMEYSVSPDESE